MNELTYAELRKKEVINIEDGKRLGCLIDVVFENCTGKVLGFVVPGNKHFFSIFKNHTDVFIPYHSVCKIGVDVILVEIKYSDAMCR